MKSLADRVAALVDYWHEGKVNAAATEIGMAQSTLQQIVSGKVRTPRADVLSRIARHYNTTMDWLMHGEGEDPRRAPDDVSRGAWLSFSNAIRDIDPPRGEIGGALFSLPFTTNNAFSALTSLLNDEKRVQRIAKTGFVDEALRLETLAWVTLLRGLLDHMSPTEIRAALQAQRVALSAGFTDFGEELARHAKLGDEAVLSALDSAKREPRQ